jgi:hypothetical protein
MAKKVTQMASRATKRRQKREAAKQPSGPPIPKGQPVLRVIFLDWQVHYYDDEGKFTGMTTAPNNRPIGIPEAEFPEGLEAFMREKGWI